MSLIRWRPNLNDPFEEVERFFNGDFGVSQQGFAPTIDVYQTEKEVVIEAPLAGVDPDDVEVSIEDNILTLKGATKRKSEVDEEDFYRKEIRYGSFHRQVVLPVQVKEEEAKALTKDGILKIIVPKAENKEIKSHKIIINKE